MYRYKYIEKPMPCGEVEPSKGVNPNRKLKGRGDSSRSGETSPSRGENPETKSRRLWANHPQL